MPTCWLNGELVPSAQARVSVGVPFYDRTFTPFMVLLLVALPLGALLPWKRGDAGRVVKRLWWAAALALADQSAGEDLRVVEHQQIACPQAGRKVGEGPIGQSAVARDVHQELKRVGGVKLPREFVFMDRAAVGLGSVFVHLDAEMNWHQMFNELITDFDVDAMEARQAELFGRHGQPMPSELD